jgi:hypothetical protein
MPTSKSTRTPKTHDRPKRGDFVFVGKDLYVKRPEDKGFILPSEKTEGWLMATVGMGGVESKKDALAFIEKYNKVHKAKGRKVFEKTGPGDYREVEMK